MGALDNVLSADRQDAGNQQKAGEGIAELSGRGMEVLFLKTKEIIYIRAIPHHIKKES